MSGELKGDVTKSTPMDRVGYQIVLVDRRTHVEGDGEGSVEQRGDDFDGEIQRHSLVTEAFELKKNQQIESVADASENEGDRVAVHDILRSDGENGRCCHRRSVLAFALLKNGEIN